MDVGRKRERGVRSGPGLGSIYLETDPRCAKNQENLQAREGSSGFGLAVRHAGPAHPAELHEGSFARGAWSSAVRNWDGIGMVGDTMCAHPHVNRGGKTPSFLVSVGHPGYKGSTEDRRA